MVINGVTTRGGQSMIIRHVPSFFRNYPQGEHWRLGIGGSEKGPAVWLNLPCQGLKYSKWKKHSRFQSRSDS